MTQEFKPKIPKSSYGLGHSGTSKDEVIKKLTALVSDSLSKYPERKKEEERLEALLANALEKPAAQNEWKKEKHLGGTLYSRPIDPEIVAKMPKTSRTFIEVGPIELIIHDIKKALHPYDEIPF